MVVFAIAWRSFAASQVPVALLVGKDYYLPGPAVRLAKFATSEKFSRDGQFITFVDERPEKSYVTERTLVSKGDETSARSVVRFDLKRGIRQVLFSQNAGETLIDVVPVGQSGDVICTATVGAPQGDQLEWKAVYCPVAGSPRVVASERSSRSFQVASSETENKAFILICGMSGPAKYLYLTPDTTVEKSLDTNAFQCGFFQRTRLGNPIASLQGAGPNYEALGNFEFNFATGNAKPIKSFEQSVGVFEIPPIITFDAVLRSKGDPTVGQIPLYDIFASSGENKDGKKKLIVAQGVVSLVSNCPNGLAFTYLTDDGFFVKEMVKADPIYRKKLGSTETK